MGNQLYAHPDGHSIDVAKGMLTVTDSEGQTLIARHDTAVQEAKFTPERAGAVMDLDLINELLAVRGQPQAEAFGVIHDKLYALSKLEQFDSAAGGFAGAVVNVLEVGIANLPKLKRKEC